MSKILHFFKKLIPDVLFRKLQPVYHYVLNYIAAAAYGFPSEDLIVVGVTGTTGKTTVTYMAAQILGFAGVRTGYTSTAMFSDGKIAWLNDKKMTMVGRFFTQKMLRKMVNNDCRVAIIETTSEGAVQYRHRFINYDVMVFTGLYPEHIESHGGFDNYKKAKQKLFAHVGQCKGKTFVDKKEQKTIIVNLDDEHAKDFICFDANRKIGFSCNIDSVPEDVELLPYSFEGMSKTGTKLRFDDTDVQLQILGEFNATNATAAGSIARAIGVNNISIKKGLEQIVDLPGRIERIDEWQDFTVIVDYAFEPVAVSKLYDTVRVLEPKKIIHVLGSTGGGRDLSRRKQLGSLAGERADVVIVTNEDPYDDDPREIIEDVAAGAQQAGKTRDKDLLLIDERRDAIAKAISLAETDDLVLITGKGSEQAIAGKNGALIPWDDRSVVREILQHKNS
jgi:UDP-N-acetylmuramoyl-L-alanyl-D-glutamate--2,6-diaminopimelate ligase